MGNFVNKNKKQFKDMATAFSAKYIGDLRTQIKHLQSDTQIITDAPLDNNGKGESFSPTDLLATALATCMMTILAIRANTKNIFIGNPTFDFTKTMQSSPRKVSEVSITFTFYVEISIENRKYLESEARKCPVALSIASDINQQITFIYK